MPELPEVETVVRSIRPHIQKKQFNNLIIFWDKTLSGFSQSDAANWLREKSIKKVCRRGKYIILELTTGFITIHLRMTGKLIFNPENKDAPSHLRVRFSFSDGSILDYTDIRKFGRIELVDTLEHLETKLGREPEKCTVSYLSQQFSSRKRGIKSTLLDQSIIAGLGNIYTDEILWKSKIHPETLCKSLSLNEISLVIDNMNATLIDAIQHMGTSFLTFSFENDKRGQYGEQLNIFGKADQPCSVCSSTIQKIRVAQRGTYFCPECQKKH